MTAIVANTLKGLGGRLSRSNWAALLGVEHRRHKGKSAHLSRSQESLSMAPEKRRRIML